MLLLLAGEGRVRAEDGAARDNAFGEKAPGPTSPASGRRQDQTSDREQQILVSGGESAQRVRLLQQADALRETTLKALGQRQERYPRARPILCLLQPGRPSSSPPLMEVVEDPGGTKIVLRMPPLPVPEPLRVAEASSTGKWQLLPPSTRAPVRVERALVGAFLTELSLRPEPGKPSRREAPRIPRWLVDVILHRHHRPNPLFAPTQLRELLDSGQIPSPLPLLTRPEAEPVPSSATEIDLARCLWSMLYNRSDGPEGLLSLLRADLSENPLGKVLGCFPSLGRTEADLLKEWTLQVAAIGTEGERVALDGPQTEAEIKNLLQLDFVDPSTGEHRVYPLEQFADFIRLPGFRNHLLTRELEWTTLRSRAHFLFHPVLDAYARICSQLATGRTQGVAQQLLLVTLERENISAKLQRIHDHLNWFEAVEAPRNPSALVQEVYRILERPHQKVPVPKSIHDALDKAEAELRKQVELARESEEQANIRRALDEALNRQRKAPEGVGTR